MTLFSKKLPAVLIGQTLLYLLMASNTFAQDIIDLGGDLTSSIPGHNAIQVTAPNVSDPVLINQQLNGFIPFHRRFRKPDGLGTDFINSSCGGCHVQNGKGTARITQRASRENKMVVKVALQGTAENGAPIDVPEVGEQLKDRSIRKGRRSNFDIRLRWRIKKGEYPDGHTYALRSPRLTFKIPGQRRRNIVSSLRMAPALVGLGLMEAIPEEAILALSDPEDSDADGISGRPQYIPNVKTGGLSLGRFGFRASHPTVEQQTAAAALNDMGITTPLLKEPDQDPEMNDTDFTELVIYQLLGGVPRARNQEDPEVIAGKSLFQSISCDACHTMTFETTTHEQYPDLAGQTIHPFSDMLLHDLGPRLADRRAEFSASGSEWRTTPLWGIGHEISDIKKVYLHDGRARSLEEAILWHGGEAENSKQAFMNLSKSERDALIAFLRSI